MNLRYRTLLLAVLLVTPTVLADSPTGEGTDKTFMWRVQRGGATVYLLGSVHAMKEDAYPLPSAMETAFDSVEKLVFEIDLGQSRCWPREPWMEKTLSRRLLGRQRGPGSWSM